MVSISYGITVCNEHKQLAELLDVLTQFIKEDDEIVVLVDEDNYTTKVLEVCKGFNIQPDFNPLNDDFAQHKNKLMDLCEGDYIFSIDADEVPNKLLLENLHDIVEDNDVDLIWVPRVNTVDGITKEHIDKWGWRLNDKGWVNYPDYQGRIYRRKDGIRWDGNVHERIVGVEDFTKLPAYEELSLYHRKGIEKQEKQNEFYDTIQK